MATDFQQRAKVLKAMAHPSRLQLLDELSRGERCVCELQRLVGTDLSTVSKHLAVLRAAGLVQDERHGMEVHYRLRVPCVLGFLECVDAVLARPALPASRRAAPARSARSARARA